MRINRYIASSGYCSRRAADRLIESGDVEINGVRATLGSDVRPGDRVTVRGKAIATPAEKEKVYLLFNKPPGVTCTSDPSDPHNIIDFVGYPERIFTVGRLDRDSRGLILLTNDGVFANRLIRPRFGAEKEYEVTCDRDITDAAIRRLERGVPVLNTVTRPCKVRKTGPRTLRIVLTQGLNRQIRRMLGALKYGVVDLCRVRIMHLTIDGLPEGTWRHLTEEERAEFRRRL